MSRPTLTPRQGLHTHGAATSALARRASAPGRIAGERSRTEPLTGTVRLTATVAILTLAAVLIVAALGACAHHPDPAGQGRVGLPRARECSSGIAGAGWRAWVLEIVNQPTQGSYVVASGFGKRAQWFRNISANPSVRVYVGSRRPRSAAARILSPAESSAALAAYATDHPRAWRTLRPVFENTLGAQISEDATTLPLLALETSPSTAL